MLERMAKPETINTPAHLSRFQPVEFNNVSLKIANKQLINNITCRIDAPGKTIILGPNGAGKSRFLRLMTGLIKPTSGNISGVDDTTEQTGSHHALVFQNPVLLRRSAYENIAFVLRQQKCPKDQLADKATTALDQAGLGTCAQTPARCLSGGEQQRLALARALVGNPAGLFLDEATASLDPASTSIVEKLVNEADINGTKVVFITHDIRQAKRLADDILFVDNGQVLVHKPARAFFKDPGSEIAQAYLDGRIISVE